MVLFEQVAVNELEVFDIFGAVHFALHGFNGFQISVSDAINDIGLRDELFVGKKIKIGLMTGTEDFNVGRRGDHLAIRGVANGIFLG